MSYEELQAALSKNESKFSSIDIILTMMKLLGDAANSYCNGLLLVGEKSLGRLVCEAVNYAIKEKFDVTEEVDGIRGVANMHHGFKGTSQDQLLSAATAIGRLANQHVSTSQSIQSDPLKRNWLSYVLLHIEKYCELENINYDAIVKSTLKEIAA